jgi:hypothetical protein
MSAARIDDKAFATLQAKAALQGVQLVRSTDEHNRETFIASRWAMCRELASADEVEALLLRMSGGHA